MSFRETAISKLGVNALIYILTLGYNCVKSGLRVTHPWNYKYKTAIPTHEDDSDINQ